MENKIKSEYTSWIFIFGSVVLFLEIAFFNQGLIFSLLVEAGMIYIGRKWMPKSIGKILFWLGIILLIISIFNMITLKFLLFAIIVHLIIQYAQSKRKPEHIRVTVKEPAVKLEKETVISKKPIFTNQLFGRRKTPEQVYEWGDINIQTGVGDTLVDLSYTVLPKGETVIFIRNIIGNVKVYIPYDVELSVNHSAIAGSTEILDVQEGKIFNQNTQVQTPGFDQAEQRIKIITSLLVGDLEVKRV